MAYLKSSFPVESMASMAAWDTGKMAAPDIRQEENHRLDL